MTFILPFWLAPAIALLLAALVFPARAATDAWQRVIAPRVLSFLRPDQDRRTGRINLALLAAALVAMALAGPVRPARDEQAFVNAQNWFVLLDVSRSMELGDIAPSRMASARDTATALIARSESRPAALILYAGDAYLAAPPSFDKNQIRALAQSVRPGTVPVDGSDTSRALALTASIIADAGLVTSRIFVLSDGDPRLVDAVPVAASLARDGHRVDIVVFAGEQGERPADKAAADALAAAGNGSVIVADALGRVDLAELTEDRGTGDGNALIALPLTSERLDLLSHWLLFPDMAMLLLIYRRRT